MFVSVFTRCNREISRIDRQLPSTNLATSSLCHRPIDVTRISLIGSRNGDVSQQKSYQSHWLRSRPPAYYQYFDSVESSGRAYFPLQSTITNSLMSWRITVFDAHRTSSYVINATTNFLIYNIKLTTSRSQWSRGLRRRSAADRLLGLRVRIPPGGMGLCLS